MTYFLDRFPDKGGAAAPPPDERFLTEVKLAVAAEMLLEACPYDVGEEVPPIDRRDALAATPCIPLDTLDDPMELFLREMQFSH